MLIRHKYIDRICILICILAIILTIIFMNGTSLGIVSKDESPYQNKLFDDTKVHSIDIVIDENNWDDMIQNASEKEYTVCNVVIDGENFNNVAIRTKGNSSLSMVKKMDSDRYSFKIEFDHYDNSESYYGLDKLSLNNIIQDPTYMKDYLSYHMMNEIGIAAPLSSFVNITVNGEDFGFYVAVEGVEESLIERNYGSVSGKLYKPDNNEVGNKGGIDRNMQKSSVSLQYIDDNLDSYNDIWDGAIFDITESDKYRLLESIKKLNNGEDLNTVVDIESVLKYFVVHNFVLNFDSYTGNMQHNYYLYENEGQLSVIPWDYNLSFGAFTASLGARGNTNGTEMVNFPIDSPVSGTTMEERPLLGKLLEVPEYKELYHQYFDEFIADYFESGKFEQEFDRVVNLISNYVENDPTAFYSYEEFKKGVETLKEFCLLRAQSVRGQLDGSIPSTEEGQSSDSSSLIDADYLSMSDMGSMNMDTNTDIKQGQKIGENNRNDNFNAAPRPNMGPPPENEPPINGRGFNGQDISNIQNSVDNVNSNTLYLLLASIVTLILGTIFVVKYERI